MSLFKKNEDFLTFKTTRAMAMDNNRLTDAFTDSLASLLLLQAKKKPNQDDIDQEWNFLQFFRNCFQDRVLLPKVNE